jgi:hypothetical protein
MLPKNSLGRAGHFAPNQFIQVAVLTPGVARIWSM